MATNGNAKKLPTQQSVNQAVKAICDIMRRSNCAGALQYVPELTWILFLRILDEREEEEADEARAVGIAYKPSLTAPYRWRDWAAPDGAKRAEPRGAAAVPAAPGRAAAGELASEGHQPDHELRRAHAHRHRA
jgi:hypothetical protein